MTKYIIKKESNSVYGRKQEVYTIYKKRQGFFSTQLQFDYLNHFNNFKSVLEQMQEIVHSKDILVTKNLSSEQKHGLENLTKEFTIIVR